MVWGLCSFPVNSLKWLRDEQCLEQGERQGYKEKEMLAFGFKDHSGHSHSLCKIARAEVQRYRVVG